MRRAVALLALMLVLTTALTLPATAVAQDAPVEEPPVSVAQDPVQPPADVDGDGVPDGVDNCPLVWNGDQANTYGGPAGDACEAPPPPPDGDLDGVADGLDNCPTVPNGDQANSYGGPAGDACEAPPPPPDTDLDGVPDGADNCPAAANPDQGNTYGGPAGDACEAPPPPPDGDLDGVADGLDNCPAAANPDQANTYGGPAGDACEPPPAPAETPTPSPTPTPPPTPTPVPFGPDHPSLYGWPASVGGTPLTHWAQAAGYGGDSAVVARIDAGGSAGMTPATWGADAYYDSGKVYTRHAETEIAGTDDDVLFRTERRSREDGGRLHYTIPVPEAGTYTVRLFFTARSFDDGAGGYLAGQQVLAVDLEGGNPELPWWDVYATGGGVAGAVQTFDIEVADGAVDVDIVGLAGQAAIAAIEVVKPGRTAGDAIVEYAMQHLGLPYIWATSGPTSFDCSGFTNWVVSHVLGVHIGLNQLEQMVYGTAVERQDLKPGDLVFFYNTHPTIEGVSHVGIYIGNGQFVHASAGAGAVVVNDLTWGYYADHYYAAVRLA